MSITTGSCYTRGMFWAALIILGLVTLGAGYFLYILWSLLADNDYDLFWDDDEF